MVKRALNVSKIISSCKTTKSIKEMLTALVGLHATYLATVGYMQYQLQRNIYDSKLKEVR